MRVNILYLIITFCLSFDSCLLRKLYDSPIHNNIIIAHYIQRSNCESVHILAYKALPHQ